MITITPEMIAAARSAIKYLNSPSTPWSDEQVIAVLYPVLEIAPAGEVEARTKRWKRVVNRGIAMLDYLANDRTAFKGTGTPQAVLEQMRSIEREMIATLSGEKA